MSRIDPITGLNIAEDCGMYDYMLCGTNPGNICFPWVGVFAMTTRIGLWLLFLVYAGGIAWRFHQTDFHGTSRALGIVLVLALVCALLRLLRDIVIVAVSFQGRSSVGSAFDFVWYTLPDVFVILSMSAIYTQEFFALTANQSLREKGNIVLWGSHILFVLVLIIGGVAVGYGIMIILPLIGVVIGFSFITLSFFFYYGNKVRKQLMSVDMDSSIQMGRDVGEFLLRWMKVVAVCMVVFLASTMVSIALSLIIASHSVAICAAIQLIHRFVEVILLGFWVRHVGYVIDKARAVSSAASSAPSQGSENGSGSRRASRIPARKAQTRHSIDPERTRPSSSRQERALPVPFPPETCIVEMVDAQDDSSNCSSSSSSRRNTLDSDNG